MLVSKSGWTDCSASNVFKASTRALALAACFMMAQGHLLAWSEGGHHVIAQITFAHLYPNNQEPLIAIIKKHPRFKEDFKKPEEVTSAEYNAWLFGRAAYWPDVVKDSEWDRPKWHYQPGSTVNIGDVTGINIPEVSLKLPPNASLKTQDLHLAQAYELCLKLFKAKETSDADRAVALCWVLHLAAEAHQPCNAGALYQKDLFPNGDDGGKLIPTVQSGNLYAFWDGLLGQGYDKAEIQKQVSKIEPFRYKLDPPVEVIAANLDHIEWIEISRRTAKAMVYSPDVIDWISVTVRSIPDEPQPLELSEKYLKYAKESAQLRACLASRRLSTILAAE